DTLPRSPATPEGVNKQTAVTPRYELIDRQATQIQYRQCLALNLKSFKPGFSISPFGLYWTVL
ncbi:hypothetical protein J6590_100389, partial [Homalodisca vitripennis]